MVVTAGLAEIAAGSIAMGLGGYLAAKSDAEHYVSEKHREETEILTLPHVEREEVAEVFREYGLEAAHIEPILQAFENNHPAWVDFMMRFELGLEEPDPRRALRSAMTIAGAYIAGGLIPLAPYMVVSSTARRTLALDRRDADGACSSSATSRAISPARDRSEAPCKRP